MISNFKNMAFCIGHVFIYSNNRKELAVQYPKVTKVFEEIQDENMNRKDRGVIWDNLVGNIRICIIEVL